MANLRIPEEHRRGLETIRSMANEDFDTFLSKLSLRTGQARMKDVEADVATVQGLAAKDAKRIVSALVSLHINAEEAGESLAEDVIETLEGPDGTDSAHPEAERESFKRRLQTLLSLESLRIASKAVDLQTEYDKCYCKARIMTDMRPVFATDVKEGPKGVVVVHMLKLRYHPAESPRIHREFHVALDSSDLGELKSVIERAEAKQKALEESLRSAGIPRLAE